MGETAIFCPGKINWVLQVIRRRPDGFHELDTLFLPLQNLGDELKLIITPSATHQLTVNCSDPAVPAGTANLIGKAAELFAARANLTEDDWQFELIKHIPMAAGLGGGSSDAAGALKLLNRHYKKFTFQELSELARHIGADVPFFLQNDAALAAGIGEKLTPCPGIKVPPLVLVAPGFPVSAKWAYTHMQPEWLKVPTSPVQEAALALQQGDLPGAAQLVSNNLALPLWRKFPYLNLLRDEMLRQGALAAEISGSGPTLFAVTASRAAQHHLAVALRNYCAQQSGVQILEV